MLEPHTIEIIIKLSIAMTLGIILGIERIVAHKTAGMRTYALVSMGAAAFVMISDMVIDGYIARGVVGVQPTYVLAQIVVAIGFLTGGLFIVKDSHVFGLTTASGLWISAAIGSASGYGFYALATIATFLTLFVFTGLWLIEDKVREWTDSPKEKENTLVK